MEFLKENFEIIMLVSLIVIVLMISVVISLNRYFMSYYLTKKFKIDAQYEVDAKSGNARFTIKIFNNNINDIRVAGFGFVYKNHNIDFYKKYLSINQLPDDHKLVIPSRDYIFIYISVTDLKNIIYEINEGAYKVGVLSAFVTDSLGLTTVSQTKTIKKRLYLELKKDYRDKKRKIKEAKKRDALEKKILKKKRKQEKKLVLKEKIDKVKIRFKNFISMFKKRSKSK
jgi:hypothetical protein